MVDAWDKKVGEIQSMLIKSPQYFGEKRDTQADDPQFLKNGPTATRICNTKETEELQLACLEKS